MSEGLDVVQRAIENEPRASEKTRRQFVSRAAVALGGMGVVGALPASAWAGSAGTMAGNDTQTILNVAATAEVLATIVNTIGFRQEIPNDDVTLRNIRAAAQEELRHYDVLTSLGEVPATKRIWVPYDVFKNQKNFLNTLVVGDQIFINAYLIGVGAFAKADPKLAAVPAEFMGAEAVHRALALQSLKQLGNDRIFMKVEFTQIGEAVTPSRPPASASVPRAPRTAASTISTRSGCAHPPTPTSTRPTSHRLTPESGSRSPTVRAGRVVRPARVVDSSPEDAGCTDVAQTWPSTPRGIQRLVFVAGCPS